MSFDDEFELERQVKDLKRNIQTTVNVLRQIANDKEQTVESLSYTIEFLASDLETICLK